MSNKKKIDFQWLQDAITEWADEVFGKSSNPEATVIHLGKEIDELLEDPRCLEEYADVGILWLNAAAKAGYTVEQLYYAMIGKFWVNKKRKWSKPDPDGVVEHVRDPIVER